MASFSVCYITCVEQEKSWKLEGKLRQSFKKDLQVFFMEQKLTCANHSDEDIVLNQIGWAVFICPKCGSDYSIGRKVQY